MLYLVKKESKVLKLKEKAVCRNEFGLNSPLLIYNDVLVIRRN
jgi:hypothetical protein